MARKPKTSSPPSGPSPRSARSQGAKLGRKPVPENETRNERFIRIGTKRVNNAIRQIQLLGNLCSPNYECDENDLALMRAAILRELDGALARFSPKKRGSDATFSFKQSGQAAKQTSLN